MISPSARAASPRRSKIPTTESDDAAAGDGAGFSGTTLPSFPVLCPSGLTAADPDGFGPGATAPVVAAAGPVGPGVSGPGSTAPGTIGTDTFGPGGFGPGTV